jgi:hypothetical protein
MKQTLAVVAAAMLAGSAGLAPAFAQAPTTGAVTSSPPAVDTGSAGYQGTGGGSTTTPESAVPNNQTGSAHYQSHHGRTRTHTAVNGSKFGTGHGSSRTSPVAAPGTVPNSNDATARGAAPGGGNGGK